MYITPLCFLLVGATICLSLQNPPSDTKQHDVDEEAIAKALSKALGLKGVLRPVKGLKKKVPKYILDSFKKHAVNESEASGNSKAGDTSVRTTDSLCSRHDWIVTLQDFFEVIIPTEPFNAYYCSGRCPVGLTVYHTHSMMQSMDPDVPEPCCVPKRYSKKSVLYHDENNNVLKDDVELVVEECGCQ